MDFSTICVAVCCV